MNRDVGLAYPFHFSSGRTAAVGGTSTSQTNGDRDAAVQQGALQVMQTNRGGRVMLGNFGAGLERFLFQPIPGVDALIPHEVRQAIKDFCPRAIIRDIRSFARPESGTVDVVVVVRHNDSENDSVVQTSLRSA